MGDEIVIGDCDRDGAEVTSSMVKRTVLVRLAPQAQSPKVYR